MNARSTGAADYTPVRTKSRMGALGFLARHWILHLTLITLALVFVFPFIWMLMMSIKTDEEVASAGFFPEIPTFRESSPFVRNDEQPKRPEGMSGDRWDSILPRITATAEAAAKDAALPKGADVVDTAKLRTSAVHDAINRALQRVDTALFTDDKPEADLVKRLEANLTPADLTASFDDRLGRLELRGLTIRSLTGHVTQVPAQWRVVSGTAQLLPGSGDYSILKYGFSSASAEPVVLETSFNGDTSPEDLHRIVVAMKGDASWHRFDAEMTVGGKSFRSNQTTYVAQHRAASMLLQPPTFQDETLSAKTWVEMEPVAGVAPASTPAASGDAANVPTTIRLTLKPSSTPRAIYGKLERNYLRAFRAIPFWTYVGNSVILVVLQMGGALFSSAFVGYAFARLNWPGRGVALGILLSTMMLPSQVTMIPSFMIWRTLGWYNTLNPLWIGAWLGNAFFIFLMVQHLRTIPKELDEAARIDGLNAVQTWYYVILPQTKPTLAAIAIMTFMGAWNEFMGPLVMLRDQTKFPLSLGLFSMRLDAQNDWSLIMAGNLLMTVPVIVIFFLFQRYFVEGVTVSGMKG